MTKNNLWRMIGLLIVPVVILKDQFTKFWVMTDLFGRMYDGNIPTFIEWLTNKAPRSVHPSIEVTSFFNWVMVWNKGVSFGMLNTNTPAMIYILSGFAVLVSIGFLVWMWRDPRPLFAVCIGMIVGGALGNALDRLRFGAVADFLDFHIGDLHWPAFNVADASISVGVVLLLVDMFLFSPSKAR